MSNEQPTGLVDLHCHILPGIDDGPATPALAAELVQGLEALGFTDFYPTPHQKKGSWAPLPGERDAAADQLRELLTGCGSTVRIHPPAGENMWDELFLSRQDERSFPLYPGERAFLLEFQPDAMPPRLEQRLFDYRIANLLPVVAHVERYPALAGSPPRMAAAGRSAALLINLTTIGGGLGYWAARAARKLIQQGLIHGVATDSHGAADVPFCKKGLHWLRSRCGPRQVELLLRDNPRRIVAGELPEP